MSRFRGFAVGLVAVLALGALGATGAQAVVLTAKEYPATLDGTGVEGEPTIFNFEGKEVVCKKTTLSGTLEKESSTVVIGRGYSECTIKLGESVLPVTIKTNGCAFELHLETKLSMDIFQAKVDIVCEGTAGIEFFVYVNETEHKAGKSLCVLETPPQKGLETVELNNMTEAVDVTVTPRVKGITYKRTGSLLCGALNGTANYTGSTTMTGTNKNGEFDGLTVK